MIPINWLISALNWWPVTWSPLIFFKSWTLKPSFASDWASLGDVNKAVKDALNSVRAVRRPQISWKYEIKTYSSAVWVLVLDPKISSFKLCSTVSTLAAFAQCAKKWVKDQENVEERQNIRGATREMKKMTKNRFRDIILWRQITLQPRGFAAHVILKR